MCLYISHTHTYMNCIFAIRHIRTIFLPRAETSCFPILCQTPSENISCGIFIRRLGLCQTGHHVTRHSVSWRPAKMYNRVYGLVKLAPVDTNRQDNHNQAFTMQKHLLKFIKIISSISESRKNLQHSGRLKGPCPGQSEARARG